MEVGACSDGPEMKGWMEACERRWRGGCELGWMSDGPMHKEEMDGWMRLRGHGEVDVSWEGQVMGESTRKK